MKQKFLYRRTTIIGVGLATFLIGLGVAKYGGQLHSSWLVLAFLFILVGAIRKGSMLIVAVIFAGFVLGWMRGGEFLVKLQPYEELYDQKVVLQAQAQTDAVYGFRSQLEFDVEQIHILEPSNYSLPGKIKVSGFGANAVNRGDIVQIEGKLQPTLGSRQGRIGFAEIKNLGSNPSLTETLRRKFLAGMQTALPEPLASFAAGLLVGQRTTLPENTTKNIAAVGLTHIIAVSGYNLTIIMRAVRRGLRGRSKYQTTMISVVLMLGFLLVTGFSASIVRAAIVSGLSLAAWYYGRTIKPLIIILLAASITAGWHPIYLWYDLGWYLSFLAFFGVLILAPLLVKRFYKSKRQPKILASVAIESMCAQIMTVPLVMWVFHEISIVAPISNLLIVPMVPLAMLLALIAGLAGMIAPMIAGWLAWPARVLLTYMLDIVHILAQVPHALLNTSISTIQMVFMYVLLGAISLVLWQKTKLKHATITDEEMVI
jgi:competence protein ComEC